MSKAKMTSDPTGLTPLKPGKQPKRARVAESETLPAVDEAGLLADLRALVQAARQRVATAANATHTMLCWYVGQRLLKEDLQHARAAYGKQILVTVSRELMAEFGSGYSYAEIARMVQFCNVFPDEAIVATLSQQLSWSHFHALLPLKDPLARDFYAEMCRIERWNVRTLRQKIGSMLFERTALSKNTKEVISSELDTLRNGQMTPALVFRDPYVLDFLGLTGPTASVISRALSSVRSRAFCWS